MGMCVRVRQRLFCFNTSTQSNRRIHTQKHTYITQSMAALTNGVSDVIDAALSSHSPPPPNNDHAHSLLERVSAAAAAFVERELPARNARLVEAAVSRLLALVPAAAKEGEGEEGGLTIITLSLSSTLMAVFKGLWEQQAQGQQGQQRGTMRVVRCKQTYIQCPPPNKTKTHHISFHSLTFTSPHPLFFSKNICINKTDRL